MYVVEIEFASTPGSGVIDADEVHALLGSWTKHGQLRSFPQAIRSRGTDLVVTGVVHLHGSLDPSCDNLWAEQFRGALAAQGVRVSVTVLGEDGGESVTCVCPDRSGLVMFTSYLSDASPLRCDDCFGEVPLHTVPTDDSQEHLSLLHWRDDYQACDTLQMHCTVGERFGERQLADVQSALTREGRRLAAELEERAGIPIFYYLSNGPGRSRASEQARVCPGCGGDWLLAEPRHDLFDFRCPPCRLLSNVAWSVR